MSEMGCSAESVEGIRVAASDPSGGTPYALGYPPYAMDGCRLLYVAAPAAGETAGALMLRDLSSGAEEVVASAEEKPRRPSIAGDVMAWEAEQVAGRVVRFRAGGVTETVNGFFDHAGEPRAAADGVVFTAFLSASDAEDTDVYFVRADGTGLLPIAVGAGQQRFADVSATHVAYSDFSEDPDGHFSEDATDLADIVVYDRVNNSKVLRQQPGKQAFPMLGASGKVAYLGWGPEHPEPKFSAYQLRIGDVGGGVESDAVVADITTSAPYVRPAAQGDRLFWVQWPSSGQASLWEQPADLSAPAEMVPGIGGASLYGPASSSWLTVAAALGPDGMGLEAAAH